MRQETIERSFGSFAVLDDGIIVGYPKALDLELRDAMAVIELLRELTPPGQRIRLLLDHRSVSRKLTPEAQAAMKTLLEPELDRLAVLIGNTVSRFLASTMMRAFGQGDKVRVFESEGQALSWLREARRMAR